MLLGSDYSDFYLVTGLFLFDCCSFAGVDSALFTGNNFIVRPCICHDGSAIYGLFTLPFSKPK